MVIDGLLASPRWLLVGVALGVGGSAAAAAVFVLADRYFPDGHERYGRRSGDSRRRAELREYLDAIGERYAEDHVVDGQRVAFYLPERDVAITFDARAYYRIERSGRAGGDRVGTAGTDSAGRGGHDRGGGGGHDRAGTVAVLVEHEMPGIHLGDRLPFETPPVDAGPPTGADRGDPATAAFAELDLSPTASLAEVKAAYRRRVKETHPDQGGDEDEFKRVREAYTVAKNRAG